MFLNKGMKILTAISIRAFLILFDELAHLRFFIVYFSFSVFGIMVVHAMLVVVVFRDVAGVNLENGEIEMLNKIRFTLTVGVIWN